MLNLNQVKSIVLNRVFMAWKLAKIAMRVGHFSCLWKQAMHGADSMAWPGIESDSPHNIVPNNFVKGRGKLNTLRAMRKIRLLY
jgi:hypothetical protein